MYELHAIGLNMRHTGNFVIDRPKGSGDMLLIIYKTDALLDLGGGPEPVPPDSAVIFPLGAKQYYRSVCGSFVNHFMHFGAEPTESPAADGIAWGRLLSPENIKEAEELLSMISREQVSPSTNKGAYISMLIRLLLMKLSEHPGRAARSVAQAHYAELSGLRAELYSNAGQFGSVQELSERAHLSPSHFQQLYKQQFGISCYEDLLSAKVRAAQYYLGSTALSIKEIAALCGYSNDISFMHGFKQRTGLTPSEYRKRIVNGAAEKGCPDAR